MHARCPSCRRWLRAHWRGVLLIAALTFLSVLGRLDGPRVNAGDCRVFYDSAAAVQR